jgi:uncharacterized CHY-type Zn-finger protein
MNKNRTVTREIVEKYKICDECKIEIKGTDYNQVGIELIMGNEKKDIIDLCYKCHEEFKVEMMERWGLDKNVR